MSISAGKSPALVWAVNISVLLLVALWTIPTFGLLVSSVRDKDQLATSGWWTSLTNTERNLVVRTGAPKTQTRDGALYVLEGNVFGDGTGTVTAFGWRSQKPTAFAPGVQAEMRKGLFMTIAADGAYRVTSPEPFKGSKGKRLFIRSVEAPIFTLNNYREVLFSEGLGKS